MTCSTDSQIAVEFAMSQPIQVYYYTVKATQLAFLYNWSVQRYIYCASPEHVQELDQTHKSAHAVEQLPQIQSSLLHTRASVAHSICDYRSGC
jgi:hypothetical protein